MRFLPFVKPKNGFQFAGGGVTGDSGGGNIPVATTSQLGGVKVGSGLAVTNDGTLSVSGGGVQYSTTEFDTGQKWIDGKTIYGIVYTYTNNQDLGQANNWYSIVIDGSWANTVDNLISAQVNGKYSTYNRGSSGIVYTRMAGTNLNVATPTPVTFNRLIIFYTKA